MKKIAFLLFVHIFAAVTLLAVDPEWVERWKSDLHYLREQLPEVHPDPYHRTSREELGRAFSDLEGRLPALSHGEITTELARIVAMIGDGHTRLTWPLPPDSDFVLGHSSTPPPKSPSLLVHTFPLRLGVYADGVYVERVEKRHQRLLGAELVGIEQLDTAKVIARLEPLIARDNAAQLADLLPLHLVLGEALRGRGVIATPERATFRFRRDDGVVESVALNQESPATEWSSAAARAGSPPLSWRHLLPGRTPGRGAFRERHWFEWLPGPKVVYLQFNESYDDPEEKIVDLAARLRKVIEQQPVKALVIDLRYNFGGDNTLNLPLLHALIAADELRGTGKVRVLIGRGTFSAAMMFALDLEKHIRPVFIGERTGARPNAFGDSRKRLLPETGITIRISSLYWQYGGAKDERDAIAPHIELPVKWSSMSRGVDEALEIALAASENIRDGEFSGRMTLGSQQPPLHLSLSQGKGELTLEGIIDRAPLQGVKVEGANVWFSVVMEGKPFVFEGVSAGNYVLGHAVFDDRRGNRFPFALKLREVPTSNVTRPEAE